jgi:hypothetical protein
MIKRIWVQKDLGANGFGFKSPATVFFPLANFSLASSDSTRINLNVSIPAATCCIVLEMSSAKMTANAEGKSSKIPVTKGPNCGCCGNQKPKVQPVKPQLVR